MFTQKNKYFETYLLLLMSNRGDFAQTEQVAHEYANGLACAVGFNDTDADMLTDADIDVATDLAKGNMQPERLEKLRRGYLAVHDPKWVTAVFEKELEETRSDFLNAGRGRELTTVPDDRFLGVVLKTLLDHLKGEVFDSDANLANAIREVLDTVSKGQTLFGRIKAGGLGTQAYRRSRFLKIAGDAYVINWARTFIKEFYPATLSKRGDRYSLVHDKKIVTCPSVSNNTSKVLQSVSYYTKRYHSLGLKNGEFNLYLIREFHARLFKL